MVDEHCQGNLVYPAEWILTILSATRTEILVRVRSTKPHGLASTHTRRLLTQHISYDGTVSVVCLDLHLPRTKPSLAICYDVFKGWLLLSLPPRCFGSCTMFQTFDKHLWTLTALWAVALLIMELTPHNLLHIHVDERFGVC